MDTAIAVGIPAATTFAGDDAFRIDELMSRIAFLENENKKLSETVDWMHSLIWDMYKKMRNVQSQA